MDLLVRIFGIVFPLVFIVGFGYFYARKFRPDLNITNQVNLDVFVPLLMLDVMLGSDFTPSDFLELTALSIFVVLASGLLAWPFARIMGYELKTFVPPMMFTNSGNMGLPLMVFTFGEAILPAAIVVFTVENLLHFTVGSHMMARRSLVKSLVKNPIVIATVVGLTLSQMNIQLPNVLAIPVHMMGQVTIPLMLFALGVRLIELDFSTWKIGVIGAIFCPLSGLVTAYIGLQFISLPEDQLGLFILFSALPPAVLNFVVAERYNQQPHLVASLVFMSNLGSLIVIPITLWFIL